MYHKKKILALIPARGGSKGILNKNIINLNGQPLISYTIQASLASKYIDDTVVTTDRKRIAEVAAEYGARVPFLRPIEIADDASKTVDAVLHAIRTLESCGNKYGVLVLLQPTQPLRTSSDIDSAVESFFQHNEKSLVSVSEVDDHPLLIRTLGKNGKLGHILEENSTCRRQDMEKYYRVNGCIYINRIDEITENTSFNDNEIGYVMPREHSVDIDEMKDLEVAGYYLKNR